MNITMKGPNCLSEKPKLNFKGRPKMCGAINITSNITKHVRRINQGRNVLVEQANGEGTTHKVRSLRTKVSGRVFRTVQNCLSRTE